MKTRSENRFAALLMILFLGLLGFLRPADSSAESLGFSFVQDPASQELALEIQDDLSGAKIADASIQVSDFSGKVDLSGRQLLLNATKLTADLEGRAWIANAGIRKVITVSKPGYVTATLAGIPAGKLTVFLRPLTPSLPEYMASGTTEGWRSLQFDLLAEPPVAPQFDPQFLGTLAKPVQVGLVLRGMSSADLFSFDLSAVISPINDVIDIFGSRDIPSNFVMPEQTIPVFFTSVRVNKPNYRLPVRSGQDVRLVFGHGTISSSDLVDLGQNGPSPGAVNKVSLQQLGFSSPLTPRSDFTLNLTASLPLAPTHRVQVQTPPFTSDVLVAALTDLQGNGKTLIPTDVKAPLTANHDGAPAEVSLKSLPTGTGSSLALLTVAISPDQKRISGIMTPSAGATVQPGGFLTAEEIADSRALPASIRLQAPAQGVGTLAFEALMPGGGRGAPARPYPLWNVYTLPSAGAVTVLPPASFPTPVRRYSVSKAEFAAAFDEAALDGQGLLAKVSRFSRSSALIGK